MCNTQDISLIVVKEPDSQQYISNYLSDLSTARHTIASASRRDVSIATGSAAIAKPGHCQRVDYISK